MFLLSDEESNELYLTNDFQEFFLFEREEETKVQFSLPYGICIKGEDIFVCDWMNHQVQVIKTNGKTTHTFGKGQLGYPSHVALRDDNVTCVTDNRGLHFFDEKGKLIKYIHMRGAAEGLSCDSSKKTFVCDYWRRKEVFVFDSDFEEVSFYKDHLIDTRQVDILSNGNLLVIDKVREEIVGEEVEFDFSVKIF